jgi:sigma-E factor negative regulatory protein RseC
MIETGYVIGNKDKQAVIRIQRKKACENCGMCKKGSEGMEITLSNPLGAKEGDRVEVSMGDTMVLKASMIVYAIPLLFLLIGAALGYIVSPALGIGEKDLAAALCGIVFTALSYMIVRSIDKKVSAKQGYIPRITRILDKEE